MISRVRAPTIDNLVSADVVTADGRLVKASDKDNADLFWALRGGGGNFGVVTSFEFALQPLGPEVMSGLIVYPLTQARDLIKRYRDVAAASPDELTCWFVLRTAPPLPFCRRRCMGRASSLRVLRRSDGRGRAGDEAVAGDGRPIADVIGPIPLPAADNA
jgi:FAD/FMN-containing dehydrogenase